MMSIRNLIFIVLLALFCCTGHSAAQDTPATTTTTTTTTTNTNDEVPVAVPVSVEPVAFYVNPTSGSDTNDGRTDTTPFKSLQIALDQPNVEGAYIILAPGRYGGRYNVVRRTELVETTPPVIINIRSAAGGYEGAAVTVFDESDQTDGAGVFTVGPNVLLAIEGVTFRDITSGPAIHQTGPSLVQVNRIIGEGNNIISSTITDGRGAIFNMAPMSELEMYESRFQDNVALRGGVIYANGNNVIRSFGCEFLRNHVVEFGNVAFTTQSLVEIVGSRIIGGDVIDITPSTTTDTATDAADATTTTTDATTTGRRLMQAGTATPTAIATTSTTTAQVVQPYTDAAARGSAFIMISGQIQMRESECSWNRAGFGACIQSVKGGSLTIIGSDLGYNTAHDGAAIGAIESVTVQILNTRMHDSIATRGGGAIHTSSSQIEIADSHFYDNSVAPVSALIAGNGGAIDLQSGALLLISNTVVERCTSIAIDGTGGGISIRDSNMSMRNVTMRDNLAYTGGGALSLVGTGGDEMEIQSSSFTKNECYYRGGAIAMDGVKVVMTDCVTNNNRASTRSLRYSAAGGGGAIAIAGVSDITIGTLTAMDNDAPVASYGGGILIDSTALVRLTDSRLEQNHCTMSGGAISVQREGILQSSRTRFIDNRADQDGGAIGFSQQVEDRRLLRDCPITRAAIQTLQQGASTATTSTTVATTTVATTTTATVASVIASIGGVEESKMSLQNLEFTRNTARDGGGGAIYYHAECGRPCQECVFTSNTATFGPAIATGARRMQIAEQPIPFPSRVVFPVKTDAAIALERREEEERIRRGPQPVLGDYAPEELEFDYRIDNQIRAVMTDGYGQVVRGYSIATLRALMDVENRDPEKRDELAPVSLQGVSIAAFDPDTGLATFKRIAFNGLLDSRWLLTVSRIDTLRPGTEDAVGLSDAKEDPQAVKLDLSKSTRAQELALLSYQSTGQHLVINGHLLDCNNGYFRTSSTTCDLCPLHSYNYIPGATKCQQCPDGALCVPPEVFAAQDHWRYGDNQFLHIDPNMAFQECGTPGGCCPKGSPAGRSTWESKGCIQGDIHACDDNRVGTMCGSCAVDYVQVANPTDGTVKCKPCTKTSARLLIIGMVLICCFVAFQIVMEILMERSYNESALLFLQVVPFVSPNQQWATIFNLDAPSLLDNSSEDGTCTFPATVYVQIKMQYLVFVYVWFTFFVGCAIFYCTASRLGRWMQRRLDAQKAAADAMDDPPAAPATPPVAAAPGDDDVKEDDDFLPKKKQQNNATIATTAGDAGDDDDVVKPQGGGLRRALRNFQSKAKEQLIFNCHPRRVRVVIGRLSLRMYMFTYVGVIEVACQLLFCQKVGDDKVLMAAPNQECWTGDHVTDGAYSAVIFIIYGLLLPNVIAAFVLYGRWKRLSHHLPRIGPNSCDDEDNWYRQWIYNPDEYEVPDEDVALLDDDTLVTSTDANGMTPDGEVNVKRWALWEQSAAMVIDPFKYHYSYFYLVNTFRCLAILLIATGIADTDEKNHAMTFCLAIMFVVHVIFKPYAEKSDNQFECVVLFALLMLSYIEILLPSQQAKVWKTIYEELAMAIVFIVPMISVIIRLSAMDLFSSASSIQDKIQAVFIAMGCGQ